MERLSRWTYDEAIQTTEGDHIAASILMLTNYLSIELRSIAHELGNISTEMDIANKKDL